MVKINGEEYIFVRDTNNDGKFAGPEELLGFSDSKNALFSEMGSLDKNGDGYVTSQEMANGNVKLLKIKSGALTNIEYPLDNIKGVKLSEFKETAAAKTEGTKEIAGTFNVDLIDDTKAEGVSTFDIWSELEKMFENIKDFVFGVAQGIGSLFT